MDGTRITFTVRVFEGSGTSLKAEHFYSIEGGLYLPQKRNAMPDEIATRVLEALKSEEPILLEFAPHTLKLSTHEEEGD